MLQTTDEDTAAGTLREARLALRSGRYDEAIALVAGCEDWAPPYAERGVLVKAETIGRRDPIAALSYLTEVDDVFSTVEGRFGRDIESGRFHAAVRDLDSAAIRYGLARRLADGVLHGRETMAYHDVRMRWYRGDCDPEAPEIAIALAHPDPSIVAATYAFRGWLHAGRGEYPQQVVDLSIAVRAIRTPEGEPIDLGTLASSINALARISFEIADARGIEAAREAFEGLSWTPDVRAEQFMTMRALGWDAFMRGESGRAQWIFKEAREIAPSDPWRAMAHLDRAYVARVVGNEIWAIEELAEADRLARDVRWESSSGEERGVLVPLASLHAAVDAARAQRYAALYSRLGSGNLTPAFASAGDRRARAMAKYAQALIDHTLGRRDAAVPGLREAYAIFEGAGHHYRAMLAAASLAELTGDEGWRAASIAHAGAYPGCPLATIADDAIKREEAMPRQLSPLQRQIARALWSGDEPEQISRRFSRSLYTIERQIRAVYGAFGVVSRIELVDQARRRGLL
jgi:DNA-binding CsgD family transcriptional regulator/tetratricopeptide (TPR) repeat protein